MKSIGKWLLVRCWVARFVRHPLLEATVPFIAATYYGTLDIWGDEWDFIEAYKPYHEVAFGVLVGTSLGVLFFRGLGDWAFGRQSNREYTRQLEELLVSIRKIMTTKAQRFQSKLAQVGPKNNVFELITHPNEQIRAILQEAKFFLAKNCSVAEADFDITVIHRSAFTGEAYYYEHAQDNWNHTSAEELLAGPSVAAKCLETGEEVFEPDKKKAAARGQYLNSERDRRRGGNGSIFCKPVSVAHPNAVDKYLITFATYGKPICDPSDREAIDATLTLFQEFARRIELELILHSIKTARAHANGRARTNRRQGAN